MTRPITLADQMSAWIGYRQGWCMRDIADMMRKYPTEVRVILYGSGEGGAHNAYYRERPDKRRVGVSS